MLVRIMARAPIDGEDFDGVYDIVKTIRKKYPTLEIILDISCKYSIAEVKE